MGDIFLEILRKADRLLSGRKLVKSIWKLHLLNLQCQANRCFQTLYPLDLLTSFILPRTRLDGLPNRKYGSGNILKYFLDFFQYFN
jgi:hypothetical protein